jgi:hypothetical protein
MGRNSLKRAKMARNGAKWPKNSSKWAEMGQNGQK